MNPKTPFTPLIIILLALQGVDAKRINAMRNWTNLSQRVCVFLFSPSILCTRVPELEEHFNLSNFVPGQESSVEEATDPLKQPVWLGLRH